MPEMPEVEGLVAFLNGRLPGRQITKAQIVAISALKTYDPPIESLIGATVRAVQRHGKFLDVDVFGVDADAHLVFHLAKAGWLRWYDTMPATVVKPGRTPIALRVGFDDGSGFDLTEAGTKKSLAVYVARSPADVPGIARLGPDPLAPGFTRDTLAGLLAGRRTQIKGVLRDQSIVAGIGNAYSDEILHVARLSPYALAATLSNGDIDTLYAATVETLTDAVATASGKPPADLKDAKRRGMRVHGRRGEACPVCGDVVRSVFFADNSLEYCATCQTGGKILADRRLSRLLK
ncbi:Fpg/Nei family DNA glycosylase [Microbacterium sp. cx-55]|uniref:Fpg/Nei family DNA glycosylase n=1 Tax=unclassified Microbacterium TaxID=2609290 RepID=UPI001CBE5C1F|nr:MULTISPECIES: DNA-formamidopyrimidine glycosylase family protein [unclassified Microbacterium]MBZ4487034.1 Fpg/Nei family DNA glycosylase [Microbacterium sp. cx-55]MCC4907901.1 Fpg/Nei family DNA glycosylase [Microbacterium sp. cx-59]UGB35952.1 Fpg/Nei family DNA glycosylase [Microbacterium sp. cx-55]